MLRPDFLIEEHSLKPKVCEINARFPLNGFLVTYFGSKSLSNYLDFFGDEKKYLQAAELSIEKIVNFLGVHFDLRKPIGIVKRREVT